MNANVWLNLALAILGGVAKNTENKLDDVAIAGLQGAIENIKQVQGSPVTRQQLEELRVDPMW